MKALRVSLVALLVAGCAPPLASVDPVDPDAGQQCELDGMVLRDYPGPKGQIRYADGKVEYYCDTLELLSITLQPEQVRKVAGVYVQDMGKTNWEVPKGHWIDATTAFYVQGSSRTGSMGPTFASFTSREDADKFAAAHGGKVLAFADISADMVQLDGGASHDLHG
ncbi:nitrous oxide reductase accessory protein NosL [Pseudoxanthomonas sp. 22568]|uniref:nitrous oxide reductase accessory protein NosL n=1 Tax=Pseudoxanthomonas sp. 22568 TaxID=3453945 RepID=UPI003F85EBB6